MSDETIPPDLQACLLCDDVRQERNGKFILIGLFDTIGTPQFPLVYPRLCIVSRWCSGEGNFFQHSVILAPDQRTKVIEGKPIPIRLPSPEATATNVEFFMNVAFKEEGTHWIEVLLNDDLKLRFPLRVNQIHPAGPAHGFPADSPT